jgi:transglutaminase-like putative cysteine protease
MQINLLRQQGFAARLLVATIICDMEEPLYELHAWVEVFYQEQVS